MPSNTIVYDKAKYHFGSIEDDGLDEDQAYVHTAFYFRWILENKLYSHFFEEESKPALESFEKKEVTALEIYRDFWGGCLVSDMLSEEGNAFSQHFFDFDKGDFLKMYCSLLEEGQSVFSLAFNEAHYTKIKAFTDQAYAAWKNATNI